MTLPRDPGGRQAPNSRVICQYLHRPGLETWCPAPQLKPLGEPLMQMLYNSDSFIVVQFDVPTLNSSAQPQPGPQLNRGGFEIVDKFARKEIFIEGALAESFQQGVQALMDEGQPSEDELDAFIERYAVMGQQPVVMH
jgi:hypothetical protein